jgi:mannose-6-phosphate isomerase-like protein (cupin superfamily)
MAESTSSRPRASPAAAAVLPDAAVPVFSLPGLTHQTVAGRSAGSGGERLEVWKQTLAPGAATPPHFHECEEVVCVLEGSGEVLVGDDQSAEGGKRIGFAAECTLVVPPRQVHQIINTGSVPMRLMASLSESPGRVFLPSGERLALPWEQPA